MKQLTVDDLKKFAKAKYNVLLSGRHGCGKTAMIKEVFTDLYGPLGVNWLYFSASTLDVFTDIIGVPTAVENPNPESVHRTITRFAAPEGFTGDEPIKAIFFDEVNRADEKTLNSMMELVQFKSVNGRKFHELEVVWGAENPAEDAEYMVRRLDPAQKDRFQIQLNVPYELPKKIFTDKFGEQVYQVANKWWSDKVNKDLISPRKLEEMLTGHAIGFSITAFSNECKTLEELEKNLNAIQTVSAFTEVAASGDAKAIKSFFTMSRLKQNQKAMTAIPEASLINIIQQIHPHMDGEVQKWFLGTFQKQTVIAMNRIQTDPSRANSEMSAAGFDLFKDSPVKSAAAFEKAIVETKVKHGVLKITMDHEKFFVDGKLMGIGKPSSGNIQEFINLFSKHPILASNVYYQASKKTEDTSELTSGIAWLFRNDEFKRKLTLVAQRISDFFTQLENNAKGAEHDTPFNPICARFLQPSKS